MTRGFLMLDLETRSAHTLKESSYRRYAQSQSTGVLCVGLQMVLTDHAGGVGEAITYIPGGGTIPPRQGGRMETPSAVFMPGDECPPPVVWALQQGLPVYAHNAVFDRNVWKWHCVRRLGWPEIPDHLWRCTMAIACWQCWPRSLEKLAIAAGLKNEKDMVGNHVMHQCAQPRKPSAKAQAAWAAEHGNTPMPLQWWEDYPRLSRVWEYCRQDVATQTEFLLKAGPLPADMQADFELDFKINERGLRVDIAELLLFNETVEREMAAANVRLSQITASPAYPHGFVPKVTSRDRMVEWLYMQGVSTASLDKASVQQLLSESGVPAHMTHVRELLEIKKDAGLTSLAKVPMMISLLDDDERLRHSMLWHGASTGRWAGRGWQPHNLPRDVPKEEEAEKLHETLRRGERLPGKPLQRISNAIRTLLLPSPGNMLLVSDFNAIEARAVAWLADCEMMQRAFMEKRCPYRQFAARIFGVAEDSIAKSAPERQLGKVAVLALQYGMGGTARNGQPSKFQATAALPPYNWALTDERSKSIVDLYRTTYKEIPALWKVYEAAWVRAVVKKTAVHAGKCVFFYDEQRQALVIQLPSGRLLWYQRAGVEEVPRRGGRWTGHECYYWAEDSVTRRWSVQSTWGGTIAENITQAVACDLLKQAIQRVENAGFPVVLSVHDEVVSDSPLPVDRFDQLMCETPSWAAGLQVACETKAMRRYGK